VNHIPKKYSRSLFLAGTVIIVSGVIAAFLVLKSSTTDPPERETEARMVETRLLEYTPVEVTVRGEGFIRSARTLSATAMTGGNITSTYMGLKSGVEVGKGQLLVVIDDEAARNDLALARVELIRATASMLSAVKGDGTLYSRWSDFFSLLSTENTPLPPLPEVDSNREKVLAGTFGILSAYYGVREQETLLEYHRVTAPFSGTLDGDGVPLYSAVSPGSPLFTLTDTLNLELTVQLTGEELRMLNPAKRSVRIFQAGSGDESLPGELVRIDNTMQRESQGVNVHIEFRNPESNPSFLPGNYAEVLIPGIRFESAFSLPRTLLNTDGTINTLEEGRLVKYPVEVLTEQADTVILAPTLPEGTELVLSRLQTPLPGMELRRIGTP